MLREVIRKEITSVKLNELTYEDVDRISTELTETAKWCSVTPTPETCHTLGKVIEAALNSLSDVRLMKSTFTAPKDGSIDAKALSLAKNLVVRYYTLALSGLMTHDGKVPVKFNESVRLGRSVFERNSLTYVEALKAILLEELGVAETLLPPLLK